jgi:hypothetical protein
LEYYRNTCLKKGAELGGNSRRVQEGWAGSEAGQAQ